MRRMRKPALLLGAMLTIPGLDHRLFNSFKDEL